MFINPMWQDEVERIGKQRCTPAGYHLRYVADLLGLIGILLLGGVPCYLIYTGIRGSFSWLTLWLLLVPFAVAVAGDILHGYSWHLADVHEFNYDYESRVSTCRNRAGDVETFDYEAWREEFGGATNSKDA